MKTLATTMELRTQRELHFSRDFSEGKAAFMGRRDLRFTRGVT